MVSFYLVRLVQVSSTEAFSELREWFASWKRDNPLSFWVAILLPWIYAVIAVGVPAILITSFPFSDAKQALQLPPSIWGTTPKTFCKMPSGTYLFGYDLAVESEGKPKGVGRVCRDVLNGGWVISLD